jgi:hypothetical protein
MAKVWLKTRRLQSMTGRSRVSNCVKLGFPQKQQPICLSMKLARCCFEFWALLLYIPPYPSWFLNKLHQCGWNIIIRESKSGAASVVSPCFLPASHLQWRPSVCSQTFACHLWRTDVCHAAHGHLQTVDLLFSQGGQHWCLQGRRSMNCRPRVSPTATIRTKPITGIQHDLLWFNMIYITWSNYQYQWWKKRKIKR